MLMCYHYFSSCTYTKQAISSYINNSFHIAKKIYLQALDEINDSIDEREIDFWEDERLLCCKKLTNWYELYENIMIEIDQQPIKLLTTEYGLNSIYTSYYLESAIHLLYQSYPLISEKTQIYQLLNQFITTHIDQLNSYQYYPDLIRYYTYNMNIVKAEYYIKQMDMYFINQFHLKKKQSAYKLLTIRQEISETKEFFQLYKQLSFSTKALTTKTVKIKQMLLQWKYRYTSDKYDIADWDILLAKRLFYVKQFNHLLQINLIQQDQQIYQMYLHSYNYIINKLALAHSYYYPARKYIYTMVHMLPAKQDDLYMLQYRLKDINFQLDKTANISYSDQKEQIFYQQQIQYLEDHLLTSTSSDEIYAYYSQSLIHLALLDQDFQPMDKLIALTSTSKQIDVYFNIANYMKHVLDSMTAEDTAVSMTAADVSMTAEDTVANDTVIVDDTKTVNNTQASEYEFMFISYALESIILGYHGQISFDPIIFIPRIINILIQSNNLRYIELFKKSKLIPTWKYLQWIPQLLAYWKINHDDYIYDILLRIAQTYPNALLYEYNALTMENSQHNDLQLSTLIKNPLLIPFIHSLQLMTELYLVIKPIMKQITQKIKQYYSSDDISLDQIKIDIDQLYHDFFYSYLSTAIFIPHPILANHIGDYNKQMADDWFRKYELHHKFSSISIDTIQQHYQQTQQYLFIHADQLYLNYFNKKKKL